jgi:hypothetical protein
MAFSMESTILAMTGDMRGKLHGYMGSLEHRFGDPEVYALQREAAAMAYAERQFLASKGNEHQHMNAYTEKRQTTREQHDARIETRARPKYSKF